MPSSRDPWLDNAKMGLIVLVVVGHVAALLPAEGPGRDLYDFVYLWHMPAFVLLSGYLSRGFGYGAGRTWRLVTTLLVPYLLFEGALGWFRLNVGGERVDDLWADPHFPMWYLLALVVWRLLTPLFRPLWGGFAVAVAVSLAGGFLQGEWIYWMDLPRILGFLPFFVLGLKATPESLEWLRGRFPAVLGLAAFAAIGALAMALDQWTERAHLYYRPFALLEGSEAGLLVTRLLLIAVGVAGAAAWLTLVPRVGGWFTRMGSATMIVYLFHGFAVKAMEYAGFDLWAAERPVTGLLAAVASGIAIALLLAAPPVRRVLAPVVDPFGSADRRVREAVALAAVAQQDDDPAWVRPVREVGEPARSTTAGR